MTAKNVILKPDHTALRVALWRALHVELDAKPHVFTDTLGAELVGEENWRERPDMNPDFSKSMRASIVGRARFVEDLLAEAVARGVQQYVILGAGLDTFAQRRPELLAKLKVFEVDSPSPQAWKQQRLQELGIVLSPNLHFVPVDFESGDSWLDETTKKGFDPAKPAFIVSTGVSMYLSRETNFATLQQISKLAAGSSFAMTFLLALDLLGPDERGSLEYVMKRAAEAGTPFHSLFSPQEILSLAQKAGFKTVAHVSASDLFQKYFADRTDGLQAGTAEGFLIAGTYRA